MFDTVLEGVQKGHLYTYGLKEPLVDTADSRDFPDRQVVHERLDRLWLKLELELPVRLILPMYISEWTASAAKDALLTLSEQIYAHGLCLVQNGPITPTHLRQHLLVDSQHKRGIFPISNGNALPCSVQFRRSRSTWSPRESSASFPRRTRPASSRARRNRM